MRNWMLAMLVLVVAGCDYGDSGGGGIGPVGDTVVEQETDLGNPPGLPDADGDLVSPEDDVDAECPAGYMRVSGGFCEPLPGDDIVVGDDVDDADSGPVEDVPEEDTVRVPECNEWSPCDADDGHGGTCGCQWGTCNTAYGICEGCGEVDEWGFCDGDDFVQCVDGGVEVRSCNPTDGCGWVNDDIGYYCCPAEGCESPAN
jgi:hypothetical protein